MIIAESYIGSNDFWNTLIGAFIGLTVGALGAWAAIRSNNPKKSISWEEHSNQSLVPTTSSGAPYPVTVSLGGSSWPLTEARLVELKIRNTGRRDVSADDFTLDDDSLVFDFGAHIAAVLDVAAAPPSAPRPSIDLAGSELKIKKSPILKGQELSLSVLVNGPAQPVSVKTQAILNTPVRPLNSSRKFKYRLIIGGLVVAAAWLNFVWFTQIQPEFSAQSKYRHIQDCRYWDVHDPARAKKECPEIEKP
ncbi:hypothetical protein [Streptomyces albogriseolus]|uniref:hypothetical protein n=1 Tax=Streptomyces albogriseolus TaxID=1887 RepID=UPI0010C119C3